MSAAVGKATRKRENEFDTNFKEAVPEGLLMPALWLSPLLCSLCASAMDVNDIARLQIRKEKEFWLEQLHQPHGRFFQVEFVEGVYERLRGCKGQVIMQGKRFAGRANHVSVFHWEDCDEKPWVLRSPIPVSDERTIEKFSVVVATNLYLMEHSEIPVPQIIDWGVSGGPYGLPWSIAYLVEDAVNLSFVIDDLTEAEKESLLAELDQIVLQFTELRFDKIGSLSVRKDGDESNVFEVTERPWSVIMDDEARDGADLIDIFPIRKTFDNVDDYTQALAETQLHAFKILRNAAQGFEKGGPVEDLRDDATTKVISRLHLIANLPEWRTRNSDVWAPVFALRHGDFTKMNIMIDKETKKLRAIVDFEFSRVEPIPFHRQFRFETLDSEKLVEEDAWNEHMKGRLRLADAIAEYIRKEGSLAEGVSDLENRLRNQEKYDYFFQHTLQQCSNLDYIALDHLNETFRKLPTFIKQAEAEEKYSDLIERKVAERIAYEEEWVQYDSFYEESA